MQAFLNTAAAAAVGQFFAVWNLAISIWNNGHPGEESQWPGYWWQYVSAAVAGLGMVAFIVINVYFHRKSSRPLLGANFEAVRTPSGADRARGATKPSMARPKVIADLPISEAASSPQKERGRAAVEEVLQRKIYYPLNSDGSEQRPMGVLFMEEQELLKAEHEQWAREHPARPAAPPRLTATRYIREETRRELERNAFEEARMQEAVKAGKASYAAEQGSRTRRLEDAATGGYATHEVGSREMVAFDSVGNEVGKIHELRGGAYAITFINGKTSTRTLSTAATAIEALVRESWR